MPVPFTRNLQPLSSLSAFADQGHGSGFRNQESEKPTLVEGCAIPPIPQNARNGWGTRRSRLYNKAMLIEGVFAAVTTPFYPDERVYFRKLEANMARYSRSLLAGMVVLGSTGEAPRSEEHTSELQSLRHLVCRLLLEKQKITTDTQTANRSSTLQSPMHLICPPL